MPEFASAFSGLAAPRKLGLSELVRAVRFMIAAEYEAIQLYEQLAESTGNHLARKVLADIADEEKEHVGEFRRLLSILAPQDEPLYTLGMQETDDNAEMVHKRFGVRQGDSPCADGACCAQPV